MHPRRATAHSKEFHGWERHQTLINHTLNPCSQKPQKGWAISGGPEFQGSRTTTLSSAKPCRDVPVNLWDQTTHGPNSSRHRQGKPASVQGAGLCWHVWASADLYPQCSRLARCSSSVQCPYNTSVVWSVLTLIYACSYFPATLRRSLPHLVTL